MKYGLAPIDFCVALQSIHQSQYKIEVYASHRVGQNLLRVKPVKEFIDIEVQYTVEQILSCIQKSIPDE